MGTDGKVFVMNFNITFFLREVHVYNVYEVTNIWL